MPYNGNIKLLKTFLFSMILLTIFIILKSFYFYKELNVSIENDIKKEAQVLTNYIMSMRYVYHKQFISSGIELNDKTLGFLPAHASSLISDNFSSVNNYYVRNVSDRPRNPKNKADIEEQKAINFFNKHKKNEYLERYITNEKIYYQFAKPIYIEKYCLKCHGNENETFNVIKQKYNTAFNYKEGDLRGIVSIKIPSENVDKKIDDFIKRELTYIFMVILLLLVLFRTIYKKTNIIVEDNNKIASDYAMTDSLTGLYNRHFIKHFDLKKFVGSNYYIIFFDIDYFKRVNDKYGHICGDFILKEFSSILKSHTRENDVLCRYGGEEFILIIKHIDEKILIEKLEEIRVDISENEFVYEDKIIRITTSIGFSQGKKSSNFNTILDKADKALYEAKRNGRNRIEKDFSN